MVRKNKLYLQIKIICSITNYFCLFLLTKLRFFVMEKLLTKLKFRVIDSTDWPYDEDSKKMIEFIYEKLRYFYMEIFFLNYVIEYDN